MRALPNLADALLPLRDQGRRAAGRRRGDAQGRRPLRARRPARLRGRPRAATCAAPGEVVVERGLAREWGLAPGDRLTLGRGWAAARRRHRASSPTTSPSRSPVTPRVYVAPRAAGDGRRSNLALLWLADPDRADITLAQARATSFGIGGLAFVTRAGIEVLLGQAAGHRASRCSSRSRSSRSSRRGRCSPPARRPRCSGGCRRSASSARSASRPARLAARQAREAALRRRAGGGARAGARRARRGRAVGRPARRSSTSSRPAPRCSPVLAACLARASPRSSTAAATWPAWRAARRPPAEILRGGDLAPPRRAPGAPARGGLLAHRRALRRRRRAARYAGVGRDARGLRRRRDADARARGAARAAARRPGDGRQALPARPCGSTRSPSPDVRGDPGRRRRRRALPDRRRRLVPARRAAADDRLPGRPHALRGAAARRGAAAARATARSRSASGSPTRSGLRPGATLAVQTAGGGEARFRVVGIVRALERDGRIAYVRPARLLAAQPDARLDDLGPARRRAPTGRGRARAGGARRAAAGRSAAATTPQRGLPRRARGRAARRRARGRARLPLRARPGARHDRARAARRGRAAARVRRRRARPSPPCSPAPRSPSRCRRRSRASLLEWLVLGPLVAPPGRGLRRPAARARAPARSRSSSAACSCSPPRRPRSSRAAPCASPCRGAAGGMTRARRSSLRRCAVAPRGRPAAAATAATRRPRPAASTLDATLADPDGDGALERGPGEPLRDRTELAPRGRPGAVLATFAQITDTHVRDEESPARVPFLDRLGGAFSSTFRPQEALSTQVLAAAVRAVNRARARRRRSSPATSSTPRSGRARPGARGARRRRGRPRHGRAAATTACRRADDPDPLFYRPDLDAPRHPGLLDARRSARSARPA